MKKQLGHPLIKNEIGVPIGTRERIYTQTRREASGCLVWTGRINKDGYGQISIEGHAYNASRAAWVLAHGPLPGAIKVDHLCHNQSCVELSHLRAATHQQNMANRRGPHKQNTSGFRGVTYNKAWGKYVGSVHCKGKAHYCGGFDSAEEADYAVRTKRQELYN